VDQGVRFFVLRDGGEPAACGGILLVPGEDGGYGEIKRMYTRPAFRGRGHGRRVLEHLLEHGREAGYRLFRLETGVDQVEAIGLYEALGFRRCPPFGPYREDPLSPTYELRVEPDRVPEGGRS
jgi:putative acetyltransferase